MTKDKTRAASLEGRVSVKEHKVLADDWGVLTKYEVDLSRRDGERQCFFREAYDRGHGATILLYDDVKGTVLLTQQFRLPAHLNDHHFELIETCAGLLDLRDPETAIRQEAEEETGVRVGEVAKIGEIFMSPGSVTERLHFFVAPYTKDMAVSEGGGVAGEGEDIGLIEVALGEALEMIDDGRIIDAKTIILIQHAALKGLCGPLGAKA